MPEPTSAIYIHHPIEVVMVILVVVSCDWECLVRRIHRRTNHNQESEDAK